MTTVEALEAEARQLAPTDLSRLLERLVASLDADPAVEAEGEALAAARQAELDSRTVQSVGFEEAVARLETRFPG